MGVPKLFAFFAERYPLIMQLIEQDRIPEFDHLYLDMNGIIHNCSHSNDDVTKQSTEEQIYLDIFNYVSHLFDVIRPKKTFFLAVDGVAPRAKLNQQRSRRFRSAREYAETAEELRAKGHAVPDADTRFDSNCITPGTEFMARLSEQIKYLVAKKITEDSTWQGVEVVISGHEVPGEGEHKVMDYIRARKASPDYDPATRHCLYGLDADLITLGLVTHDPSFSLLREEVVFSRQTVSRDKNAEPEKRDIGDSRFYLLHLCLLREYMDKDFHAFLASVDGFTYDFERVLDDVIVLLFFVGNDFLPHLPLLHIKKGGIDLLLKSYRAALVNGGGYVNDHGKLNLGNMQKVIDQLARYEKDIFMTEVVDSDARVQVLDREAASLRAVLLNKLWTFLRRDVFSLSVDDERAGSLPKTLDAASVELGHSVSRENREFFIRFAAQLGLTTKVSSGALVVGVGKHLATKYKMPTASSDDDDDDDNAAEADDDAKSDVSLADIDDPELRAVLIEEQVRKTYAEMSDLFKDQLDYYANLASGISTVSDEDISQESEQQFALWRSEYYADKLGIDVNADKPALDLLAYRYMQGFQWVLYYYFCGVPSWGWFYDYHYAPRVSDIQIGHLPDFTFELGQPLSPFEQLMGVLPSLSSRLIPAPLRPLMTDDASPIKQFYPEDFASDLNEKDQAWEAVVKIPFIDVNLLKETLKPILESKLSPEEKARNTLGRNVIFSFDNAADATYPSSLPGFFLDIEHAKIALSYFDFEHGNINSARAILRLLPGAAHRLPGFPSLDFIPHETHLEFHGTRVFTHDSKNPSLMINVENPLDRLLAQAAATPGTLADKAAAEDAAVVSILRDVDNARVFVDYPYLWEGQLASIETESKVYSVTKPAPRGQDPAIKTPFKAAHEADDWAQKTKRIESRFSKTYATVLPTTRALVHVHKLRGMRLTTIGNTTKVFQDTTESYPIAATILSVDKEDTRFIESAARPIDQELAPGTQVIFLNRDKGPLYGAEAFINHADPSTNTATLTVNFKLEAPHSRTADDDTRYNPAMSLCRRFGFSNLTLTRITSDLAVRFTTDAKVVAQRYVLGLDLRNDLKRLKANGYTRKVQNPDNAQPGWEFSDRAADLIDKYVRAFPELVYGLEEAKRDKKDVRSPRGILPESFTDAQIAAYLDRIAAFRKEHKIADIPKVPVDSEILDLATIRAIEQAAAYEAAHRDSLDLRSITIPGVPRFQILKPADAPLQLVGQTFACKDIVSVVADFGRVPILSRGTVIGVHAKALDVIFDKPFMGGTDLGGLCSNYHGATIPRSSVVNLTRRQFGYEGQDKVLDLNARVANLDLSGQLTFVHKSENIHVRPDAMHRPQKGILTPSTGLGMVPRAVRASALMSVPAGTREFASGGVAVPAPANINARPKRDKPYHATPRPAPSNGKPKAASSRSSTNGNLKSAPGPFKPNPKSATPKAGNPKSTDGKPKKNGKSPNPTKPHVAPVVKLT